MPPAPAPLIVTLALALAAPAATAQDRLAAARGTYLNISGDWAAPGLSCADPANTWRFDMGGVRAGSRLFDLLGIGGAPGQIQLDLLDRRTGRRTPLAIGQSGTALSVRGSGLSTVLLPCGETGETVARLDPPAVPDPVPRGDPPLPEPGTGPVYDEGGILPPIGEDADAGASAEASFAANLAGPWSRGGESCDWRLGADRIFADGQAYEVVNFSGSAERIGIQALRDDGTPTTFTVTRTGPASASVSGSIVGGEDIYASLTRC